jgi:hypothetical protein
LVLFFKKERAEAILSFARYWDADKRDKKVIAEK